jgi:predicted AAA+ superfamily ATPase
MAQQLYPRWQSANVTLALKTRRIVMLAGPRQSGKTTLARETAGAEGEYRTLDDVALKAAAENDPHGFVKSKAKMLVIDEVQRAPMLLPALKKAVDEDTRAGQFLLTGSANFRALPGVQESLAGRIASIRLRPLTQGEILSRKPHFVSRAFAGKFGRPDAAYDRDALLELAFRGGFPEVTRLTGRARRQWHLDYVDALIESDIRDISRIQRKDALHDLFGVLAAWSGKFMDISAIGSGLSIRRPTLESYINALESMFVVERLLPWVRTDYERVARLKKLFMADSGMMASLLRWQFDQVRFDPDRSGKLIETFAFNEIAAQVDAGDGDLTLFHYRDREKREIDFIVERDGGALLGIEVKAGSAVGASDFKYLKWFKAQHSNRPFTGIVLYSGVETLAFGDGFWAVPFAAIWA